MAKKSSEGGGKFVFLVRLFFSSVQVGDSLLDVVVNNDLALDGFGACDGEIFVYRRVISQNDLNHKTT